MNAGRGGLNLRRTLAAFLFSALAACGAFAVRAQQKAPAQPTTISGSTASPTPAAADVPPPAVSNTAAKPNDAAPPVIAVVHRVSGWKLRALLTPPDAPVASSFDEGFVRTNIVAGYVMADGRSVVARLPPADAEMLTLTAAFRDLKTPSAVDDGGLWLVMPDGSRLGARFVGLDASTGLSLLEAEKSLSAPGAEIKIVTPDVGARVRVIAPVRAASPVAVPPAPNAAPGAPVGVEGVLYMSMGEEQGQLRRIKRSPSGRAMSFTVELNHVSPEWTGGVALSDAGLLVGIVEESRERETRLLSAEAVRGAAERVKKRHASVPQPWLGARGDAVALAPLEAFVAQGWPREQARTLLSQQRGVLLTAVAPGTPAARAGLRPGDVVARIGEHDLRTIEDMSLMIKELGGNSTANFTVLRAQSAPLNLEVLLSESLAPALDTTRAEFRAAQSDVQATLNGIRATQDEMRRMETDLRRLDAELKRAAELNAQSAQPQAEQLQKQLRQAQSLFQATQDRLKRIQSDYPVRRARMLEAEARFRAASEAYAGLSVRPLLSFGLGTVTISPADTKLFGEHGKGLLVTSVQPGSAAARGEVRAGDIIESLNGQPLSDANWNFGFSTDFDSDLSLGLLRDGQKLTVKLSRQNNPKQ